MLYLHVTGATRTHDDADLSIKTFTQDTIDVAKWLVQVSAAISMANIFFSVIVMGGRPSLK